VKLLCYIQAQVDVHIGVVLAIRCESAASSLVLTGSIRSRAARKRYSNGA